jgi:hypothetical protein
MKFVTFCIGAIALCQVFRIFIELARYHQEFGEESDEDEPVPVGMYS